jgi:CubicO group peptidase (beta-lactamase class C family)
MNVQNARWLLVTIFVLVVAAGCSPAASLPSSRSAPTATPPPPVSLHTPASQPSIDYVTLEAEIEKAITAGPATLDKVRAVLVNVDGETKIAHYRHGFTEDDHGHVFSVTKSVLSILIGIAIEDDLIADIDQPLVELLPKHRDAMSSDTAKVTLRQLMTMSGGFNPEFPNGGLVWEKAAEPGSSLSTYCSGNGKTSNPARPSGTPIAVLTSWPPYLRQPWNGPTATTPARFLITPGRSSSIRWASQPIPPSPRHFPNSSRLNSSQPASAGAPTPTTSTWADTVFGSLRRT